MPRDAGGGQGKSKPEMIREVLEEDPGLSSPRVRAAVWERYGGEVTAPEIARARQKLRQAQAPPVAVEPPPPAKAKPKPRQPAAAPKRPAGVRAKDFASAEVTVQQLSAMLEVAEEVGGLRRLRG